MTWELHYERYIRGPYGVWEFSFEGIEDQIPSHDYRTWEMVVELGERAWFGLNAQNVGPMSHRRHWVQLLSEIAEEEALEHLWTFNEQTPGDPT